MPFFPDYMIEAPLKLPLDICGHCHNPQVLHFGYNHSKNGGCIIDATGFGLMVLWGKARATEIVAAVNAWRERQEAMDNLGEGI